ncbi:MAG: Gfo/Idh/MocA family oxidoreductase [Opitutaceae bacterium]|nr:Gfo/Idh/MocA family oxidoreductase [Opitutaceae bacterium]
MNSPARVVGARSSANGGPRSLSRRQFLSRAAKAGAILGAPLIVPASVLGRGGAVAPSERIVMGGIGIGGRGGYDLGILLQEPGVQFVAVCDVRKTRRDAVKRQVDDAYHNRDCATFRDLRELIATRTDLDAVLIATGDRWHAPAAIMAMRAGLDVFCEKPSTMSVTQGQELVATARRYGRIFQTGMQRLSEANFVFADELARSGRLGKLHTVHAHQLKFQMKTEWLPPEREPEPAECDWDMWLGPAPRRPYNAAYLRGCGAWLDYYDFGTGIAAWGSHTIGQCQSAAGVPDTSAIEYVYPGTDDANGLVCRYANGVKMVCNAQGWPQPGDKGMWRGSCGVRYEGSEGWVAVADGYARPDVSSPSLLQEFDPVMREYAARTNRGMHHIRDFLDGVRSRRPCVANETVMHRAMSTNHVANICMLLKRNVRWDPVKEEFPGDPEANRMRSRAMREPWRG